MGNENISYFVAFTAGLLTFLSPCILPLIPSYIAYISGVSFKDLKESGNKEEVRRKTITHSLLFILGFSVIFILLGLTATFIGKVLFAYQNYVRMIGGFLIIIFGLYITGLLKLDFLMKERKFNIAPIKGATHISSFLIGLTFAMAWTPCAGPILGSILVLAGTKSTAMEGAKLLTVYSLGIAVPFFITSLLINKFLEYFNRFKNVVRTINIVGGVFLIIVGILVMTNYIAVISEKLLVLFGG
jgi:cytochrome c-type biogenesis protein